LIPPCRPEYPDIFPDSPNFPEYPEKYPETPDLYLTAVKKFVIFRFDYSPPSSRHLDPFSILHLFYRVLMHPLDHHGGAQGTGVPCMLVAGRGGIRGGAGRLGAFLDGAFLRRRWLDSRSASVSIQGGAGRPRAGYLGWRPDGERGMLGRIQTPF
jgi:hypothetical protein